MFGSCYHNSVDHTDCGHCVDKLGGAFLKETVKASHLDNSRTGVIKENKEVCSTLVYSKIV